MGDENAIGSLDPTVSAQVPYACMLRIQSVYGGLKTAERRAVDYLLEHPERVSGLTIVEFASVAGCSEATVVRLSKRLGYEGFPELKRDFAHVREESSTIEVDSETYAAYSEIGRDDDPVTVFEKVIQASVTALKDTVNIMSGEDYNRVVDLFVDAERLLFVGLGDAAIVALEARQRFLRVGKRADASLDPDTQLMLAAQLKPGDVFIAISHSGRSRTVLDAMKLARAAGAHIVAITNTPISPVAKRADALLLTAVFTRYMTVEVISKRVTELCVLESLLVNYMHRVGADALENIRKTEASVEANKI